MDDYMRKILIRETTYGGRFTVMESEDLNSLLSVLQEGKWRLFELTRRGNVYRMRLVKKKKS